jgi:hypothetical protein
VPEGQSVDISYDPMADRVRVALRTPSTTIGLSFTRRLTKGFLKRFAEALEDQAGGSRSDARAAVVFEHLDAVGEDAAAATAAADRQGEAEASGSGGGPGTSGSRAAPEQGWLLVTRVSMRMQNGSFVILLVDESEQERRLTMSREEAHRVLSALYRKAQAAGWDLDRHVGWLADVGAARPHSLSRPAQAH